MRLLTLMIVFTTGCASGFPQSGRNVSVSVELGDRPRITLTMEPHRGPTTFPYRTLNSHNHGDLVDLHCNTDGVK